MVLGFFSIASILSAYYWAGKEKPWPPISFLSLFLLLYASMAGLYFIVMGTTAHLLLSSWLLFLLAVSLLQMFTAWLDQKDFKNFTCSVLLIGGVIFNIVLFGQNFLQKRTFDKVFANHVVYQWNFHRLKAESTMDPVPFNAAVSLIQKYTNGPSVYIVSKYDMILPFLASRYSAMPWHILSEFMVTQKETQMAIDKIRSDRPELLFVDSDIERSYRYDIIPDIRPFRHLHDEAHWRAERLELLQEVFKAVEADYEPVEKTPLITAWRLRPARN